MKKKLLLKFGIIAFSLGLFCPFYTSAAIVSLNVTGLTGIVALNPVEAAKKMMNVHFADNGDDIGGFLYFSNDINDMEDLMDTGAVLFSVIADGNEEEIYKCRTPVRGFYYNAQRGERLWPLDSETWSGIPEMSGLITTGGIFTICAKSGYQEAMRNCIGADNYQNCVNEVNAEYEADGFGYYGYLEQEYETGKYTLTIGVNYDTGTDFISVVSGSELAPTFVRVENKYPVGFIYDKNGGLGLAGCQFDSEYLTETSMKKLYSEVFSGGGRLSDFFEYSGGAKNLVYKGTVPGITCGNTSFANILVKILIEGIMGLTDYGPESSVKFGTLGNSSDTKMQYFGTNSVSNTTMMNYVKKNAEQLCRGKWTNNNHAFSGGRNDKLICWNGGNVSTGQSHGARSYGRTLIVKDGNVAVSPMTVADNDYPDKYKYHDIFILSGNLLIDESGVDEFVINKKGFIQDANVEFFRIYYLVKIYDKNLGELSDEISACILDPTCNDPLLDMDGDGTVTNGDRSSLIDYLGDIAVRSGGTTAAVASVIKGNFIVNGRVKSVSEDETLKNKYFLYGKFTTKDTFNELENTFAWRCADGISEQDGNFCPKNNYSDDEETPYRNAALVVVDQNYGSPLLK